MVSLSNAHAAHVLPIQQRGSAHTPQESEIDIQLLSYDGDSVCVCVCVCVCVRETDRQTSFLQHIYIQVHNLHQLLMTNICTEL